MKFRITIMLVCVLSVLSLPAVPVQAAPVCDCPDGNMRLSSYDPNTWELTDTTRACRDGFDGNDVIQVRRIEFTYQCDHCGNRLIRLLPTDEERWSCRGYAD